MHTRAQTPLPPRTLIQKQNLFAIPWKATSPSGEKERERKETVATESIHACNEYWRGLPGET